MRIYKVKQKIIKVLETEGFISNSIEHYKGPGINVTELDFIRKNPERIYIIIHEKIKDKINGD